MDITTVQLKKSTKAKLEELKIDERESADSVINRLIGMAIDDEPLSEEEIEGIRRSLKDIEEGRVYTLRQVKKNLGLK